MLFQNKRNMFLFKNICFKTSLFETSSHISTLTSPCRLLGRSVEGAMANSTEKSAVADERISRELARPRRRDNGLLRYFRCWNILQVSKSAINNCKLIIRVAPNLTFSKYGRSRSRSRIWLKLVFWSQNNTPVIKLMTSTMLSAATEAVHFSASFVALLFASYW